MCVDAPRWRCGRLDGCVWSLDEVRKVWICGCGRLGRTPHGGMHVTATVSLVCAWLGPCCRMRGLAGHDERVHGFVPAASVPFHASLRMVPQGVHFQRTRPPAHRAGSGRISELGICAQSLDTPRSNPCGTHAPRARKRTQGARRAQLLSAEACSPRARLEGGGELQRRVARCVCGAHGDGTVDAVQYHPRQ